MRFGFKYIGTVPPKKKCLLYDAKRIQLKDEGKRSALPGAISASAEASEPR
jgi:hypothetical protein